MEGVNVSVYYYSPFSYLCIYIDPLVLKFDFKIILLIGKNEYFL